MTRVTQMSEVELRLGMPWRLQGDEIVFRLADVQHCEGGYQFDQLLTVGYIGHREQQTYFFRLTDGNILVRSDCFCGMLDEFAAKVGKMNSDSKHAQVYRATIDLAKLQLRGRSRWPNWQEK